MSFDDSALSLFSSELGPSRPKAQTRFRNWTITLDIHTVSGGEGSDTKYTRLRAPYRELIISGVDDFWFKTRPRPKGILGGMVDLVLGLVVGNDRIRVGHAEIDEHFSVQASDKSRVRTLFENFTIRQSVQSLQAKTEFGIRYAEGFYELYFLEEGIISDNLRLNSLLDLFKETLNQLCTMDVASEEDPNVLL